MAAARNRRPNPAAFAAALSSLLFSGALIGRGQALRLDAAPAGEEAKPVWIQVAREGKFEGYRGGSMEITLKLLQTVVDNLHKHPSFKAGADGFGSVGVVPYDYEHTSAMDPTAGSIPQTGVPAPAWVMDLQIRMNAASGFNELWALTELGPTARAQIKAKGYKWTSVFIPLENVDPVSGVELGPVLKSVAFTNDPFIQGMEAIAIAASNRSPFAASSVWIDGPAESPEETIVGLRNVFGLDANAPPDEIRVQLERLATLAATDAEDPTVSEHTVSDMANSLRRLLDLPTLATIDEIKSTVGQFLDGLPNPTSSDGETTMTIDLKLFAKLLRAKDDSEGAILLAAQEASNGMSALDDLMTLFGSAETKALIKAASEAVAKAKDGEKLITALQSLGAEAAGAAANDTQDVAAVAAEAQAVAAKLGFDGAERIMLALCARVAKVFRVRAEAEAEVDAAVFGLGETLPGLKTVLLKQRIEIAGDAIALAAFKEKWPARRGDPSSLTLGAVTGPGGMQLGGTHTGAPQGGPIGSNSVSQQDHPMNAFPGANPTEQARNYLIANDKAFEKKPQREQFRLAGEWLRAGAKPIAA